MYNVFQYRMWFNIGYVFQYRIRVSLLLSVFVFSKPLNYAIALNELGSEVVHDYIGQEPSGRKFNDLDLDYNSQFLHTNIYNIFNHRKVLKHFAVSFLMKQTYDFYQGFKSGIWSTLYWFKDLKHVLFKFNTHCNDSG